VFNLVKSIDKSNGYVFGGLTRGNESIMSVAQGETNWDYFKSEDVQEKYFKQDEDGDGDEEYENTIEDYQYDLDDDDDDDDNDGISSNDNTQLGGGNKAFTIDLDGIDD